MWNWPEVNVEEQLIALAGLAVIYDLPHQFARPSSKVLLSFEPKLSSNLPEVLIIMKKEY